AHRLDNFCQQLSALPTKGSPCSSSSAPGASPMNISCAFGSPTPKTTFLREEARCGHFTQAKARWRKSAKAAALASAVRAGSELAETGSAGGERKSVCRTGEGCSIALGTGGAGALTVE